MIDLPDYGYVERKIMAIDPAGVAEGSLGGPSDIIIRPGYRYGVQYTLRPLNSADEARKFESLLEQAKSLGDYVSYPWPLDVRSYVAGTPTVDGSSPPGAVIPITGLTPGFAFRIGQPMAVVFADGTGSMHFASEAVVIDDTGGGDVPVYPLTRTTFAGGLTIELERPRIRGILSWDGSTQSAFGKRPFSFSITEAR